MYWLGTLYSQSVHFGHFGRKYTCQEFLVVSPYIMAILGENVQAEKTLFSAGTFWQFWAKMYPRGIYSHPVYFDSLGQKFTAGNFFFPAGTFWPFWGKTYWLENSQRYSLAI